MTFDIELLGDCDVIIDHLARRLGDGWTDLCTDDVMTEVGQDRLKPDDVSRSTADVGDENTCDSVIEYVKCQLCIGADGTCSHDDVTKSDDVTTIASGSAGASVNPSEGGASSSSEILLNNIPPADTELVSSDFDMQGATAGAAHVWGESLTRYLPGRLRYARADPKFVGRFCEMIL